MVGTARRVEGWLYSGHTVESGSGCIALQLGAAGGISQKQKHRMETLARQALEVPGLGLACQTPGTAAHSMHASYPR